MMGANRPVKGPGLKMAVSIFGGRGSCRGPWCVSPDMWNFLNDRMGDEKS